MPPNETDTRLAEDVKALREWKHQLANGLQNLLVGQVNVQGHLKVQDEATARIEKTVQNISDLVTGNGHPETGIIVRLSHVEQVTKETAEAVANAKKSLRQWLLIFFGPSAGAIGLAAIVLLAEYIASHGLRLP